MEERPLLLSGARSGVLVDTRRLSPLQLVGGIIGIFFVLVGAVDVLARIFSIAEDAPLPPRIEERGETVVSTSTPTSGLSAHPITPARLVIPRLQINTTVERVGLNARGAMGVPSTYATVAWYGAGARPGELGNAVLAGHLNNGLGSAGVFENLHTLSIGDEVKTVAADGTEIVFAVKEMTVYEEAKAPLEKIFVGDKQASRLMLVTCNGAWDHEVRTYDKRLIVVAERIL